MQNKGINGPCNSLCVSEIRKLNEESDGNMFLNRKKNYFDSIQLSCENKIFLLSWTFVADVSIMI